MRPLWHINKVATVINNDPPFSEQMGLHRKQLWIWEFPTGIRCGESPEGRGYFKHRPGGVLYEAAPDLRAFKYVFTYPKDVLARMRLQHVYGHSVRGIGFFTSENRREIS